MAILGFDGFDNYSTGADITLRQGAGFKWSSSTPPGIITPGRGGFGRAARMGELDATLYARTSEVYVGCSLQGATSFINNTFIFTFADRLHPATSFGTQALCQVTLDAQTGYVRAFGGPFSGGSLTLLGASAPGAFNATIFPVVEVHSIISGTSGVLTVRVSGLTVLSVIGNTMANTASDGLLETISMSGASGGQWTMDDFRVNDTSSGPGLYPCNSWLGDLRVTTVFPTGDYGTEQWTPLSGLNYENVDDNPFNEGATYNSVLANGQADRFTFAALPANVAVVFATQLKGMYKEEDAAGRTLQQIMTVGGTDYAGATQPLTTSYQEITDLFVVNPATSANWTLSDLDNIVAGYKSVG